MYSFLPHSKAEHNACYDIECKKYKEKRAIREFKDLHHL